MRASWVVGLWGCAHPGVVVAPGVAPPSLPPADAVVSAMARTWATGCVATGDAAACEAVVADARWAARLAPTNRAVQVRLATVLEGAGRLDEARAAWQAVVDAWPTDAAAAWGLGRTTPGAAGEAALARAITAGASGATAGLAVRRLAAGDRAAAEALIVAWTPADREGRRARVAAASALGRWEVVIADGTAALGPPAPDPGVAGPLLVAAAAACRPDVAALVRALADASPADPRWAPFADARVPACAP